MIIEQRSSSGRNYRAELVIDLKEESTNYNKAHAIEHRNMALITSCQCTLHSVKNTVDVQFKLLKDRFEASSACKNDEVSKCRDTFRMDLVRNHEQTPSKSRTYHFNEVPTEGDSIDKLFGTEVSIAVLNYTRDKKNLPSVRHLKIEVIGKLTTESSEIEVIYKLTSD